MLNADRTALSAFLTTTYGWIAVSYQSERNTDAPLNWPIVHLYEDQRTLGALAWEEFTNDYPLAHFTNLIHELDDYALRRHGLYGKQLQLKLALVASIASRHNQSKPRSRSRLLARLVDSIDVILDSLIAALNAGTALKELKDLLSAQRH